MRSREGPVSRTRRFEPEVYASLKARRHSNREIARLLGVDEASVRRGLTKHQEIVRERRRAKQRAALLTARGRARARRFRLNETLRRMNKSTKESQ
jgi:hypothetical protein